MSDAADRLRFLQTLQEQLGGAIRFDRWMREALYHENFGYYAAGIRGIGREGDFTTWPQRDAGLAAGIARWAVERRALGGGKLIEVGAGTGALAEAVLAATRWWRRPRLHIVEVSRSLRAAQQARLGRRAKWHDSVEAALAACHGEALIYSNELVDAFPCRVFRREPGAWTELFLRLGADGITEQWSPAGTPASSAAAVDWPAGQRIEVHDSFREWFAGWSARWRRGAMLTIDYGAECREIYHRRPRGTLRAYFHHQRLEGPEAYGGFGRRDLTADVNFTDVQAWCGGERNSLGAWLERGGIAVPASLRDAGDAFQVLESTWPPAQRG